MNNCIKTLFLFLFFYALHPLIAENAPAGKIRVTTLVDGIEREYFIHVPDSYDGTKSVPLVFMLHGTSGDGEVFYNAYGWTVLADE